MKKQLLICCLLASVFSRSALPAAEPVPNPLDNHLYPPELVMHHVSRIGLSEEQQEKLEQIMQTVQDQYPRKESKLKAALQSLDNLLKSAPIPEAEARARLDEVLNEEREMKRLQLAMLVQIKNLLSEEQRRQLDEIKKNLKDAGEKFSDVQKRMEEKLERLKSDVEARASAGNPPFDVVELMQEFPRLMEQGKLPEAEQLLDKALKLLGNDAP